VSGLVAARMGRLLEAPAFAELLRLREAREVRARARQTTLGEGLSVEEDWLGVGVGIDEAFRERVAELGRDCPDSTATDFFGLQEECRLLKRVAKARLSPRPSADGHPGEGFASQAGAGSLEQAGPAELAEAHGRLPWEAPLVEAEAVVREVGLDQGVAGRQGRPSRRESGAEKAPPAGGRDRDSAEGPVPWLIDLVYDGALLRSELALACELAGRWDAEGVARVIRGWVELQCLLVVARASQERRGLAEVKKPEAGQLALVAEYFGSPAGEVEWLLPLYQVEEVDPALLRLRWQAALEGVLGGALAARVEGAGLAEEGMVGARVDEVARQGDEVLMGWVRGLRWVAFGPEPVFGYLWGLRAEADNLKAVVGGTSAGVSPSLIGEQLRPAYG